MYGRRHDMLHTYQINSQIFKLEQGSMSVTNYFATLKGLWDEFDYYRMENWSSTDDHQRYLKLLEKDRIIKFLDGLTAEFESLKGQILGLDPTPSLEQVYYKILSEEGRKRTMNNKGISTGGPPIGETSVFIGSANKFRPGGTKRQGDRFCRHCKRTNHDSDFCWEKYPEKKPEKFKHNAKKAPNSSNIAIQKLESEETIGSSVSSITGLSSTDIVNLQHLLSRLQASSSASTPADSTPFQAHTGIRGLGLSVTGPSSYSPWVIDSGATDHMTNAANSFISYSLSSGQEKVIIADGTKATVAGKGSIKLTDHFFLSSALHVPSVSINLLSVSSITKQLHCSVTFFPDHCVFQDLETKQTIGTGREVGGLYYYQLETTSALKSAAKCLGTKHQEILLWHSRLGHLSFQSLKILFPSLFLSVSLQSFQCEILSHYMHAPKTIHMKVVDRILRYLKSYPGKGLLFKGGGDLKFFQKQDANGQCDAISSKDVTDNIKEIDMNITEVKPISTVSSKLDSFNSDSSLSKVMEHQQINKVEELWFCGSNQIQDGPSTQPLAMDAISPLVLKQNYPCITSLQQFYDDGSFVVSFDGCFLVCSYDDEVTLVSMSDSSALRSLGGFSESSTSFTLSLDDRFLFTTTDSHQIQVWELSSCKCIRSWKGYDVQ
ncbi:hypothetical protein ZIOFF_021005 [Zingiber officinale]|uniref:Gag-pol polyprotein n=1 Tax=Zingiber officinale TaxID=94328 RepID=A0A8J5LLQ6_ZINOF|nr:hypothetical protein ZIOFF_021005 [Zingiber officinale]